MRLGPTKTLELFVGPINGPKGSDLMSSLQTSRDKLQAQKPAGLAPCGLSGLHRMTLVITDGEFWWSWRELNPRPKFLHPRHYMLSQSLHSLASCGQTRH